MNLIHFARSLIILRGLPGSGKSALAKLLSENNSWPIFSVDDYFTDAHSGEYDFNFAKNHLAYKQCFERTESAMLNAISKIFLDNVFSLEWEMEPYFKLAAKMSYTVFVVTVENRHQGKNRHHISEEQLSKMAEKYKVVLM